MKTIRMETVLWGATLCIALGLIFYLVQGEQGGRDHQEAHTNGEYKPEALLDIRPDALQALEIIIKGKLSRLEKNSAGQWFNHTQRHDSQAAVQPVNNQQPHQVNAGESARLAHGVAMFARVKVDRIIQQGDGIDRGVYGLDFPGIIVLAYTDAVAPVLTLHIGDLAPDGIGRYVYLPGIQSVAIIPNYQASNIVTLIAPTVR